jgi:hypothetical protein
VSVAEAAAQDAPGKIIAVDFGAGQADEAPPAFGSAAWYAKFRAEYVRLKGMSIYERMAEKDARRRVEREAERAAARHGNVPIWAWYQRHVGIYQTIHVWKAERYTDPDPDQWGAHKIRYTPGALVRVKEYAVEPAAIEALDAEAEVWLAADGRTWLWSDEHRALQLEKRYLREATDKEKSHKYGRFAQSVERRGGGPVAETLLRGWIAEQMGTTPKMVKWLLLCAENVYALRAALGVDTEPVVRLANARVPRLSAVESEVETLAA